MTNSIVIYMFHLLKWIGKLLKSVPIKQNAKKNTVSIESKSHYLSSSVEIWLFSSPVTTSLPV